LGTHVDTLKIGQRIGIPWLGHTCGQCGYCLCGSENLCDQPLVTGYSRDGGFSTATVADARFALPLPEGGTDESLAPLLCAGPIGWRALRMAGGGRHIGLYGFGASAHILAQVLRWQGRKFFAFTRPGDTRTQSFALDAAILFAPDGAPVPLALAAMRKAGRVVCAGGVEFLEVVAKAGIRATTVPYPLRKANEAPAALKAPPSCCPDIQTTYS
jgi:propanol-preferring alcohol dehydrogenase